MKQLLLFVAVFLSCTRLPAQNADINMLKEVNVHRNTSLDGAFTLISASVLPVAAGIPVALWGSGLIKKDATLKRNAWVCASALATTTLIATALKYGVNRNRPYVTYPFVQKVGTGETSPSFPSGHTSAAFSSATSLSLLYPRWYVIAPSYTWAAAVGYSRMHLGVHYPSDVLTGALIGSGSAYLCYKLNKLLFTGKRSSH